MMIIANRLLFRLGILSAICWQHLALHTVNFLRTSGKGLVKGMILGTLLVQDCSATLDCAKSLFARNTLG